jgi:hypothetical protein
MKLKIVKSIALHTDHPTLPEWIFETGGKLISQSITLDEVHMHELILFISQYAIDFSINDLTVEIVPFDDITLKYAIDTTGNNIFLIK